MKPVEDWKEEDVDIVVSNNEKENVSLDYKSSESLNFSDRTRVNGGKSLGEKHRSELLKDVSAMANSEGGLIIYGIEEEKGSYPRRADDGFDVNKMSGDRIGQIILANIHPRVQGFFVNQIELKSKGKGRAAFVVSVPKAEMNAPHQADDRRYYKRHDAVSEMMHDYEVRDMMRRSIEFGKKFGIAWDLLVEVGRIHTAAIEHGEIQEGIRHSRKALQIQISTAIRTSGVAIMALPRDLRSKAVELVNAVDHYNLLIETADPGQRKQIRLNEHLKAILGTIETVGKVLRDGLKEVLKEQPD